MPFGGSAPDSLQPYATPGIRCRRGRNPPEIDLHYAPLLRRLLHAKAKRRCPALLLDVSRVGFIDSSGISAILEYLRDATKFDGRLCVGGVSEQLRWIFDIVHLEQAMPIFDDATKAREARVSGCLPPCKQLFSAG